MKLLALSIRGFRGVKKADLRFGQHDVLAGPNGAGKSTIIDALSLVFGRTRLVRDLTEHDFYGTSPEATSRIRIVATVATLAEFDSDDPERNDMWFREGRAVPKWWNSSTGQIEPEPGDHADILCAQVAFAARFDLEELVLCRINSFTKSLDLSEDGISRGRPYEGVGLLVPMVCEVLDATDQFLHLPEGALVESPAA